MTIYKRLRDFEDANVNNDGNYEICGLTQRANAKVGDTLYFDMCMFKDKHTYIRGEVVKVKKYVVVVKYEYVDYL